MADQPLMVRRPGADAEDDGWVLDLVWNGARAASDVILNAGDLSEVAVLELPLAVPHGLHGSWAARLTGRSGWRFVARAGDGLGMTSAGALPGVVFSSVLWIWSCRSATASDPE